MNCRICESSNLWTQVAVLLREPCLAEGCFTHIEVCCLVFNDRQLPLNERGRVLYWALRFLFGCCKTDENEAFFLVKKKRPFHKKSFQTTSKSENRGQTLFLLAYKAGGAWWRILFCGITFSITFSKWKYLGFPFPRFQCRDGKTFLNNLNATSDQARLPAELKHINKRRKRN